MHSLGSDHTCVRVTRMKVDDFISHLNKLYWAVHLPATPEIHASVSYVVLITSIGFHRVEPVKNLLMFIGREKDVPCPKRHIL